MNIRAALDGAQPSPDATSKREEKKNYAERLSRQLAILFADALRDRFGGIRPAPDGAGHESPARSARGIKRLDVNYSTPELGLGLGVSIKTINSRDPKSGNYKKNLTRIDNELRAEAQDYHVRQPYAVMVAVVFLPSDACDDGRISSFGEAVRHLRPRAGRVRPGDEPGLFESIYVGIYEPSGDHYGDVWFFDVRKAPPMRRMPPERDRMTLAELVGQIGSAFDARNNPPFEWSDASPGD